MTSLLRVSDYGVIVRVIVLLSCRHLLASHLVLIAYCSFTLDVVGLSDLGIYEMFFAFKESLEGWLVS